MKQPLMSIGARLALGFGLVAAVLAAFAATMYALQLRSSRAQEVILDRLAPMSEQIDVLERHIYYVAIASRRYLYEPDNDRRTTAMFAIESAQKALRDLGTNLRAAGNEAAFRSVQPQVTAYLDSVAALLAPAAGRVPIDKSRLQIERESALAVARGLADAQDRELRRAVAEMARARDASMASFAFVFLIVLALLWAIGFVIAHSIRTPARRLVEAAHALEAGDWAAALCTLPASETGTGRSRSHDELQSIASALGTAARAIEVREEHLRQVRDDLQCQQEELQSQNEQIQWQNDTLQRQAAKMRMADERKNEFLGLLAHELRNPLAAISSSVFVLNHPESAPAYVAASRRVIDRQMRQLTRMVDDLLDVTRISQGKLRLKREVIDLSALVRECLEDHRAAARAAGIGLECEVEDGLFVDADRARVAQVLGNLLTNATKFSEPGGRIRVTLREGPDRGQALLEVTDSGMGIEAELLSRLFIPFSQGELGLARGNGGLGLGLALAKALVELHGGGIRAHSDGRGRGSRFSLWLPRAAPKPEVRIAGASDLPSVRRHRVLLVEDNADAAESVSMALSLSGHEVEVAGNGTDALARLRSYRPDVVLCDIGLPDIDGYETARRIRADSSLAHAVLVAMSGYTSKEDRDRATEAGFDLHLPKPVDMQRLNAIFEELIPAVS